MTATGQTIFSIGLGCVILIAYAYAINRGERWKGRASNVKHAALYIVGCPSSPPCDEQLTALQEEAKRRGWTVTEQFFDDRTPIHGEPYWKWALGQRPRLGASGYRTICRQKSDRFDIILAYSMWSLGDTDYGRASFCQRLWRKGWQVMTLDGFVDSSSDWGFSRMQTFISDHMSAGES
jgi:hypothetical protein